MFKAPSLLAKDLGRFLEEQIIFGEMPPDTRLVEEAIVKEYGVSRSPVREAFRELEQGGLIVRHDRKGVSVSPTHRKGLDEVYACRLPLEGLAAEEAANNRTDEDVQELKAILQALHAAHAAKDVREYFKQNVQLSDRICRASRNATLSRLLGSLNKQALRYRYMVYSRFPEMMDVSVEGNESIIEAISRHNGRHARSLTEDLILRSWRSVAAVVDEDMKQRITGTA